MRNKKVEIITGTCLLMLISSSVFAQLPDPFPNGTNVEDQAPISSLVALGLIAGAAYGATMMEK